MIGLALSLACVASSYLVQRRTPAHRPVTAALSVQAAVAVLCLAPLPARVQMAACSLLPVVSAWMYLRAWRAGWGPYVASAFLFLVAWLIWRDAGALWDAILPIGFTSSALIGLSVWLEYTGDKRPSGITQRVALVSLVGDAALVAFAVARELAPWQSRLVAVALLVVHVRWLVADRALRRSLSTE